MPKVLTLTGLAVCLSYAILSYGIDAGIHRNLALVLLSLLAIAYWLTTPQTKLAPLPNRWLLSCALLLPAYTAFQLLPLPLGLLGILSPTRAALARAVQEVAPGGGLAAISGAPENTAGELLRIVSYTLLWLLIRELGWRWRRRPWLLALPLVLIGFIEAVLGIVQQAVSSSGASAQGTFINRDHFSGFLEMVLPFALLYSGEIWKKARSQERASLLPAAAAVAVLCLAGVLLAAIRDSFSRMGFLATIGSLFTVAILALFTSRISWRVKTGAAAAILVFSLLAFLLLSPSHLIERFAAVSPDGVSTDIRAVLWRDTIGLIAAYPLVGCGLGAYGDAIQQFQTGALQWAAVYAHNDYLQILAELGIVGFLIAAAGLTIIAYLVIQAASPESERTRYLALACAGAIAAIMIHSLADFNLYIAPNAMVLAWILGLGAALPFGRNSGRSPERR